MEEQRLRGIAKHGRFASLRPTGADVVQLRRPWLAAPLGGQIFDSYLADCDAFRALDPEAYEVRR